MAEVLTQFKDPITTNDGTQYGVQACGARNDQGLWEGWIEFLPVKDGPALRSARETTQPNRTDAEYWATGLTRVYLEGALHRALNPPVGKVVHLSHPVFQEPALRKKVTTVPAVEPDAVLDPFSVFDKGERILRQELSALAAWHLVNIIIAYRLSDDSPAMLNARPKPQLIETIVARVRQEALVRHH
jgi:hypothetical protein